MFTTPALDARTLAHERAHRLRDAAAKGRTPSPLARRAVAASLRRAADHLDPAPLARTPAIQA